MKRRKLKVLVCGAAPRKGGDEGWTDIWPIIRELRALMPDVECVIHGDARGADKLGGIAAEGLGLGVVAVPAHWRHDYGYANGKCAKDCKEYVGKGAGPIRNRKMLAMRPDLVLAFHADIRASKGTRDMVAIARKAGVEARVFAK